ncbi:MAG TPA: cytochrome c [Planctomicrobium sp.]|nr:cytochrome c [Planctomicrobium sp.]
MSNLFLRVTCCCLLLNGLMLGGWTANTQGGDPARGYKLLVEKPYLTHDFDETTFSNIWKVWPDPERTQAEQATPVERRKMAFGRYGLTSRPGDDLNSETFKPLQYVVNESGHWTMNCFSCHGGTLMGQVVPGAPNTRYLLQSLSDDMRTLKVQHYPEKPLSRMERAIFAVPLGTTRGTTNAVMFGVGLMSFRDADLNVRTPTSIPRMIHHDMDAPPWWVFKKKTHLYAEAYAPRNHRSLMQFALIRSNGPEKFREWEPDFQDIAAYLESIESPKYPFPVDHMLASNGKVLFNHHCAECHGTYGKDGTYPNRVASMQEVGTDPVRFSAIRAQDRAMYGHSWFGDYGKDDIIAERDGYLAPPLDGIWASAPYFHNGAVPTLWHVLNPDARPQVWRRTDVDGYDQNHVGFPIEELQQVPVEVKSPHDRRDYFDTTQFGKSAAGHTFPDALTQEEKQAVLEYLKTL